MRKIVSVWKRQDLVNQLLLAAGFILCIVSIFTGQAKVGLIFLAVVCMVAVSRNSNLRKQMSRRYGALFFHMPDGEIYPVTFEQVKAEYTHGKQAQYNGRRVTVRFRYFGPDENGDMDTGYGLTVHADPQLMSGCKKGQLLLATGTIKAVSRQYFIIDQVEQIRPTTDKEDLTAPAAPEAEDHTKQEEN